MSSLSALGHLTRTEVGPLRDPLVVIFHLPYALLLILVYVFMAERSMVQNVYFGIAIMLYVSSTAYHNGRPRTILRKIDQTMIGLYIVVAPFPFIHTERWALPVYLTLSAVTIINKWMDWEGLRNGHESGSLIFLGMGILSAFLMMCFGIPNLGFSYVDTEAILIYIGIGCFLGKWTIYHHGWYWPTKMPNLWAAPECGHFVLSIGISIITYFVVVYP